MTDTASSEVSTAGPVVDRAGVTFRFEPSVPDVVTVHLVQEVVHGIPDPSFSATGDGAFELRFERPPVDRFEYRFALGGPGEQSELVCDPSNPLRAHGPFGERSVVQFPEYVPPDWVAGAAPQGGRLPLALASSQLDEEQPALLWSPAGDDGADALPLLVALDGLELDDYSGLTHMLDVSIARGVLPRLRALLLHPTRRTEQYSANPAFAAALASDLLPQVEARAPTTTRIGLGASLAAVALLHAHREGVGFGGLLLQSGSFLRRGRLTGVEHVARVEGFVEEARTDGVGEPVPLEMTCGIVEENMDDNRTMAAALEQLGYRVRLHSRRDAHNWVAWRDAWTPHLTDLVVEVAGR